jgi:hypothetical protein
MNRSTHNWQRTFEEPIELPDGRKLRTLADAIAWMAKEIPKSEYGMKQVQAAAHCVTEAAENGGPMIFARIGMMQALKRARGQGIYLKGETQAEEGRMIVIYVDTSKDVGDVDHLKVFANEDAAERWFAEHDPEGVTFEYPVISVD